MIQNVLSNIKNWLCERAKQYTLSYHGLKIKFTVNPRRGICSVCNLKGYTNLHHTCYNFTYSEIRKNTTLARLFTFEVCFNCHELSNSIRKALFEAPDLKLVTNNEKVKIIFEKHKKLLKKRDEFNKNRTENLKIEWKHHE